MQVGDLVSCGEYGTIGVIVKMDEWVHVLVAPVDGEDMIWFHRSEITKAKTDINCPTHLPQNMIHY